MWIPVNVHLQKQVTICASKYNEKLLNVINNINNIKLLNIVLKDKGTLENDLNKYVWFYKAQDRIWHTIAPRCRGPCVPLIRKNLSQTAVQYCSFPFREYVSASFENLFDQAEADFSFFTTSTFNISLVLLPSTAQD